jgi:lipopolysaccharide heptosyltransferase II
MNQMDQVNPRIVVLAPNWLGDVVMALPAIRDIRRHFAQAHLAIAARSSVAKIFRGVAGVNEVLTFTGTKHEVDQLKARRFDIAILLPNSFRSAWIVRRAGIPQRWGYRADFRGPLLTKAVRRPKQRVHFGQYYQELVGKLGIETGPLTPTIELPASTVDAARILLEQRGWTRDRPLIGIAPGAAFGHAKRWPAKRFAALVSMAQRELGAVCVLLGRDDDRDASQAIEEAMDGGSIINLVGHTELLSFMGVIAHCSALVANDSGALHVAAALGIPVVAIYGPTSEQFSRPLTSKEGTGDRVITISESVFCRPCWLRDCPIDHRCMTRIAPERVYASLRQLLQQETHA